MKLPLTINPLKYYDNDTGKPTGEEYWILDADGEEIACMDEKEDARRIGAAVNATAGITTEELEFAIEENMRLDFTGRAKRINKMEAEVPAINDRLLEALKRLVAAQNTEQRKKDFSCAMQIARAAIAEAETSSAHPSQPAQVIANLTRKLGDTIKALRFARSVMIENGVTETSERLAIEKIDEALKPYEPSQKPTYGPGPMIQERPRQEEADGPDPCDLAREEPPEDQGWKEQQDAVSHYYRNRWK